MSKWFWPAAVISLTLFLMINLLQHLNHQAHFIRKDDPKPKAGQNSSISLMGLKRDIPSNLDLLASVSQRLDQLTSKVQKLGSSMPNMTGILEKLRCYF